MVLSSIHGGVIVAGSASGVEVGTTTGFGGGVDVVLAVTVVVAMSKFDTSAVPCKVEDTAVDVAAIVDETSVEEDMLIATTEGGGDVGITERVFPGSKLPSAINPITTTRVI